MFWRASVDMLAKGKGSRHLTEDNRKLTDVQIAWFDDLVAQGRVSQTFNTTLFTESDSRQPEMAGVYGAMIGSFLTLSVALALSFPMGSGLLFIWKSLLREIVGQILLR